MKKFVVPVILTVLIACFLFYLNSGSKSGSANFDAVLYLETRSQIDSLEVELWNQNKNQEKRAQILAQLDLSWEQLNQRKSPTPALANQEAASTDIQIWMWFGLIILIALVVLILVILLVKKSKDAITRQMEQIRADQRFKAPKGGFQEDPSFVNRTRVRRSIIDDAAAFAEEEKQKSASLSPEGFAFEDEHGVPENKIYAYGPEDKPQLRSTAKERITSAMQSLSDALVRPKGMTRDKTMRLRAQSRNNLSGSPGPVENSPLDVTRFDQERSDKEKILQLMRRGYTNSEIARRMQISQEQVDDVVREIRDAGA